MGILNQLNYLGEKITGVNPNKTKISDSLDYIEDYLSQETTEDTKVSNIIHKIADSYSGGGAEVILPDGIKFGNTQSTCQNMDWLEDVDISQITEMQNFFRQMLSLRKAPNLDLSKVTDVNNMFNFCANMTTVPVYNLSNVTSMGTMFGTCNALSDDSLNNIMASCISATSYTETKTLKYIGLSQTQAETCTTLSNYQAFLDAGWTTGY